jgi:hypothetical protein
MELTLTYKQLINGNTGVLGLLSFSQGAVRGIVSVTSAKDGSCWKQLCLGGPLLGATQRSTRILLQAYLGDTAGSVPDHRNKASHTNFCFPSAYKSYVYTIL